jgi:hypothetical protein
LLFLRRFHGVQLATRRLFFHYLWTGTVLSFLLLSINTAKETEYMLGIFPPLSILTAWGWEFWVTESKGRAWGSAARRWALGASLGLYFLVAWIGVPAWELYMSHRRSVKDLALTAQKAYDEGRPVAVGPVNNLPQIAFYLDRRVPRINRTEDVAGFLAGHPGSLIIMPDKKLKFLKEYIPIHTVAEGGPTANVELVEAVTSPTVSTIHPSQSR